MLTGWDARTDRIYLIEDNNTQLFQIVSPPNSHRGHLCYLIQSISNPRRTYVGYTVDLDHRLRQHNGEIKGGARYTQSGRPWKVIGYVTGFPSDSIALQFEWLMHHQRRRVGGLLERIRVLNRILSMEKWNPYHLTVVWKDNYRLPTCPPNITEILNN